MRCEECIFEKEEDCPKEIINLTCEDCSKHKCYEIIEQATRDYVAIGESFTEIFAMFKTLINHDGKTVEIKTPAESIFIINRVMTALLSENEDISFNDRIYRRLIVYFFSILIDDFKSKEYKENIYVH